MTLETTEFRDLIDAAPDAMLVVSSDGAIVLVNRQAEQIFGYARGDLLGKPLEILVPERLRAAHGAHRDAYAKAPRVRAMGAGRSLRARRSDGTEFDAEISLSPVGGAEGSRVIVAVRDVTERKRLEGLTRLRVDSTEFGDLVEAAPDAMIVVAGDGAIVLVNRQAEQVFGYARGELLGQPMEVLVPRRFREAHRAHRASFGEAPRVRAMGSGMALRALRKNSSEFDAEISLSPVETAEGPRVVVAIRDVTDRKRLEELTRLREDLMRRAAARGQPDAERAGGLSRVLRWQDLELDVSRRRVFVDGGEVRLRRLEYRLLATFLEYPDRIFSRDELLYIVWGQTEGAERKRTVDTHVRRLRERLGARGDAVETVHGVGYRLRVVE
jgi:PAS domain S-box-containing protein